MNKSQNEKISDVAAFNVLLKSCITNNDSFHSHVSMGFPKGIYSMGRKMPEFWKLYLSIYKNYKLYLAENPGEESPILVDIDLKIKTSEYDASKPLYTYNQVETVIDAYQKVIAEFISFRGSSKEKENGAYTCILLEKDPYEAEIGGTKFIKHGFHLHFPKLFLARSVQKSYIIPKVKILTKDLFNNLNIDNFIDPLTVDVHWLLYGSSKNNNHYPYKATRCYLRDCIQTTLEEGLGDYVISCHPGETKEELTCHNRVIEMLPRILSIFLYDRASEYYYDLLVMAVSPLIKELEFRKSTLPIEEASIEKGLKEAEILLNMIKESRADDRTTWLNIGFCLYNISKGNLDGFTLWSEFSDQSNKYDECECISVWNKMRKNSFTLGTLIYYAKLDNPDAYNAYVKEKTKSLFNSAVKGGHNDLAQILYNEYKNEFVCTSIKTNDWYQFKNHIWSVSEAGTTLRERISNNNGAIMRHLLAKLDQLYNNNDSDDESDDEDESIKTKKNDTKIKYINKIVGLCKSAPSKNSIMTEAREIFYNERFLLKLNKNPYLIAFKNGVYDFINDIFREGVPEDYISSALPIEYYDYKRLDHPSVLEVEDFFSKIFPDQDIRDYFFNQVSQVFVGGNRAKVILFWTGEGNNGKSVTQYLFEKMLGPMAVKFSTALVTGKKKDLGGASPELARTGNGVRWAVMDEPNPKELIRAGTLKSLTGNDSFFARDLFQKGKDTFEITPMFKLHMICNKLPIIEDADKATWNRVRVIPFESTFVAAEECPADPEEQMLQKKFPMDKHFSADKVPKLVEPLAWYLIQRWKINKNIDCIEPEKVKVATSSYQQDNDIFKHFEQQCTINKAGSKITISTLYAHFKDWFKEEYPQFQIPPRTIFRTNFINMWGELVKNRHWLNKAIGMGEDSDDETEHQNPPDVIVENLIQKTESTTSSSEPNMSNKQPTLVKRSNKKFRNLTETTLDPVLNTNLTAERRVALSTILLQEEIKNLKK